MKKSRIAKFALLGASAAALAATLSTSTYAWYVSNKTATVESMDGSTNAGTADGSILLSWDNSTDSYYKNLSWTDSNAPQNVVTGTTVNEVTTYAFTQKLDPLFYVASDSSFTFINTYKKTEDTAIDADKTYYTLSGTTYTEVGSPSVQNIGNYYEKVNNAAARTAGFVRFSMYIKADSNNTTVNITPKMKNTTTSSTAATLKQIAYTATGSVGAGETFLVDAFDAMYYSLNINDADTAAAVVAAPTTGKMAASVGAVAPGAAHSYYEAVTGEDIEATYEAGVATTALSALTVGTTPIKLTWTIWLAGNDVDCYNSCAGQAFSFDLTFKA